MPYFLPPADGKIAMVEAIDLIKCAAISQRSKEKLIALNPLSSNSQLATSPLLPEESMPLCVIAISKHYSAIEVKEISIEFSCCQSRVS